jgi:hypothetical protein
MHVVEDSGVCWWPKVARNAGNNGGDDIIAYFDDGYAAFWRAGNGL